MTGRGGFLLGLALALTILSTPRVWADDQAVVGIGHKRCRETLNLIRNIESPDRTLLVQWSQGYLSGRNASMPVELSACRGRYRPLPEAGAMMKWFEQYCNRNPEHDFKTAVDVLFDSLPKIEFVIPDCKSKR